MERDLFNYFLFYQVCYLLFVVKCILINIVFQVIEKSENKDEIVNGSVSIGETPETSSRNRKGRKKR